MYDNQNNDPWNSSRSDYFRQEPEPPAPPPDGGGGGMGRRAVLTIAAIVLVLGVVGGGIAGGALGYMLNDDDNSPTVVTATPVADRTSSTGSTATVDDTSDDAALMQSEDPTATSEADDGASDDTESDNSASDLSPADIYERVSPAVVTVINQVVFDSGFLNEGDPFPAGAGTGFIISEDGYIVTNNHVVEGSDGLQIIFHDGSTTQGTLIGVDSITDLAVIKVDGGVPATVPLGNSDALRPGEEVIAIGSALGDYNSTVTAGVISGLGRKLEELDNLVQHDAPINPGNSGGPLLNMQGEVVGVNVAVIRTSPNGITAEGLAFAIPSSTVEGVTAELIEAGSVTRPFLGVNFANVTPSLASVEGWPVNFGAEILDISSGSPVADTGIQAGDIITKLNGEQISQNRSLQTILFQYAPGDVIDVELYRPGTGETLSFPVTLGTRPADLS